jgi:hypothetical protein
MALHRLSPAWGDSGRTSRPERALPEARELPECYPARRRLGPLRRRDTGAAAQRDPPAPRATPGAACSQRACAHGSPPDDTAQSSTHDPDCSGRRRGTAPCSTDNAAPTADAQANNCRQPRRPRARSPSCLREHRGPARLPPHMRAPIPLPRGPGAPEIPRGRSPRQGGRPAPLAIPAPTPAARSAHRRRSYLSIRAVHPGGPSFCGSR